jgi:hypothetical protein
MPDVLVDRDELTEWLPEFIDLYAQRPIKRNLEGMEFNHSFAVYAVCKKLQPTTIIESGVWKGRTTWLLRQCCPRARLECIDPEPHVRAYTAENASYHTPDFIELDWSHCDPETTLIVFDDHQNAYARVMEMRWWGFRHAVFEDNYPCGQGDCYSLRKVRAGCGHPKRQMSPAHARAAGTLVRAALTEPVLRSVYPRQHVVRKPNTVDRAALARNLAIYQELPPVLRYDTNPWGEAWRDGAASVEPLFAGFDDSPQPQALRAVEEDEPDRAFRYAYPCYVRLT